MITVFEGLHKLHECMLQLEKILIITSITLFLLLLLLLRTTGLEHAAGLPNHDN